MSIGSNLSAAESMPLAWETLDSPSAFTADDWVAYRARAAGIEVPAIPRYALLTCLPEVLAAIEDRYDVESIDFLGRDCRILTFAHDGVPMACGATQKGSPSAGNLEQLVSLGARHVVFLGGSGALTAELALGSVVVTTSALRDDGVSQHYEPASRYSHPSAALTSALVEAADAHPVPSATGPCWTVLAYFREARARVEAFAREGCLNVNNEAAGLFSAGRYRGIDVAAAFGVGDTLHGEGFAIDPSDPADLYSRDTVAPQLEIALDALVRFARAN